MKRPVTTLFMLMSLDGKISTGATDVFDVDQDFPKLQGLWEGLHQYYELEQCTDLWSLNSGRVQQKLGVNEKAFPKTQSPVSFVLVDNHHLNEHGVTYYTHFAKTIVIVTSNPDHPAYHVEADNLHVVYQASFDAASMLETLYRQFGCERLTIQSGGTLNALFLREKVFDFIDIVIAPVLIGGKDTSTLIDGESLRELHELNKLGILKLIDAEKLEHSYVRMRYQVVG